MNKKFDASRRLLSFKCLDDYIAAALETARYERIEGGTRVYGEIPSFRGAWAEGATRKETKDRLRQELKGWIELEMERGQPLPAVKGSKRRSLGDDLSLRLWRWT